MSELVNEIIKKPRKPRMSSIVSKAVLLKQLSSSNIIIPTKEVEETKFRPEGEWSLDLSCPPIIEKNNVELINHFSNLTKEEVIAPTPTHNKEKQSFDQREKEEEEDNIIKKEVLLVGRCDLCDVDFKSIVLFNRHTGTIRHKLALHKQVHIISA